MRHIVLAFAGLLLIGCAAHKPPINDDKRITDVIHTPPPKCGGGKLRVHFYDVGQALAALVDLPDGRHLLVDSGEDPSRPGCGAVCEEKHEHLLQKLAADLHDAGLSMLWITHQHSDHIGGASDVLERFRVESYVDNGLDGDKHQVKRTHDAAGSRGTAIVVVDPGHRSVPVAAADPLKLTVVVPAAWPADCPANANECSIGLRVDYCSSSVLFTGDAETGEEAALDTHGQVTLLQLAHHGSDTSSSVDFIKQTRPRYAVVSAGRRNEGMNKTYCHPRRSTIQRVSAAVGGDAVGTVYSFDAAVSCREGADANWSQTPSSTHVWATERDGDVVLSTTGDGSFVRE